MSLQSMQGIVREIDLFDFFRYAFRRWKIVAASVLFGVLLAVIYITAIATPIYEATAQLYVVNSKESVLNLSDLQIGTYLTSDYQLVFKTWEVNQQVIENLSLPYNVEQLKAMVEVTNPSNTRALFITASSPDAAEAARIANEFAEVASRYISNTMLTDMPTILSTALQPLNPVSPRKTLVLLLGFAAGMLLSVWGLFIAFARDDKIKTAADLFKYTGSQPLAVIPVTDTKTDKRHKGR